MDQQAPSVVLLDMLNGMMRTQAIHVAAQFRIADVLREGPKSTAELAQATGTHAPSLYRLLRALASMGIFAEVQPDLFANTELSTFLRADSAGSLRSLALISGDQWAWHSWGALDYSIKTGQAAFDHLYGVILWQYFAQDPAVAKHFNDAMTGFSEPVNTPIASAYDFSQLGTVVDVGGGHGSLLTTILTSYPTVKGVLFDQPSVIEGARERIAAAGLTERCEVVAGNVFETLPSADAYLMKQIIKDWNDERCIQILSNCRKAMKPGGRVLVVEQVILPGPGQAEVKLIDLHLLVVLAGQERTEAQYRALFDAAGFTLTRIVPTASPYSILEGRA